MGTLANSLGGFALACGLSQFPEYSQQYVQRLGGAVDELAVVTADFDATAAKSDKTREAALTEMKGTEFLEGRQADMRKTFTRFERLNEQYATLKDADSFTRITQIHKLADPGISARAWEDFQPALPINRDGIVFLLVGFFAGYLGISVLGKWVSAWRNRRKQNRYKKQRIT